MKTGRLIGGVLLILGLLGQPALAAVTDVITNGSFESGLTGWTTGTYLAAGAAGTGSYNGDTAPGTETLTSVAGFAATDGTEIALGGIISTSDAPPIISSVLYQDVAIPAGATTATFTLDIGTKAIVNPANRGARVGVYATASVPHWTSAQLVGNIVLHAPGVDQVALQSLSSIVNFNVAPVAGSTVRFAIISAAQGLGQQVIGIDNIQFLVTTPDATIPTLSEWGMILFSALLGLIAIRTIRKNRMAV